MERTVTVRTPESIAFYYELAGLGSRFLALAVDGLIQSVCVFAIFIIWAIAAPAVARLPKALNIKPATLEAMYLAIGITILFVILYGYFIFFEASWNGQTPGKRLIGIRVVRDGGYPLDFMGSLLRNTVRVIESIPPFLYLPSAVSCVLSSQNKRLGDYAAGTIVVRDRAFEVTDPKRWLAGDAGSASPGLSGAGNLTADETALVQRFLDRRTTLPPDVARETAATIAAALRPKLGPDAAALGDDELLLSVAASRR